MKKTLLLIMFLSALFIVSYSVIGQDLSPIPPENFVCCMDDFGLCLETPVFKSDCSNIFVNFRTQISSCSDLSVCNEICCNISGGYDLASEVYCSHTDVNGNEVQNFYCDDTIRVCCELENNHYNTTHSKCAFKGGISKTYNQTLCPDNLEENEGISEGDIVGTVFESNNPVRGATVTLSGRNTGSDDQGEFSFLNIPSGTYTISATVQKENEVCSGTIDVEHQVSTETVIITLTCSATSMSCSNYANIKGYSNYKFCPSGKVGFLDGNYGKPYFGAIDAEDNNICWVDADECRDLTESEPEACFVDGNISLTANTITGRKTSLAWTVENCEYGNFDVYRCVSLSKDGTGETQPEECSPGQKLTPKKISNLNFIDDIIGEEAGKYCYKIIGYFSVSGSQTLINSNVVCVDYDVVECQIPGTYCDDASTIIECSNNYEKTETSCGDNRVCVEKDGGPACVLQHACESCNGNIGVFFQTNYYDKGLNKGNCKDLDTCFLEYTRFVVDNYEKCSNINSCYDYKSERACLDEDTLKCNRDCEWVNISSKDLGFGVCRPKKEENWDCSACGDIAFNSVFSSCNFEKCSYVGRCYFNTNNDANICQDQSVFTCEDFANDRDACINSNSWMSENGLVRLNQSVKIDVSWTDGKRVGGTNMILERSDDHFNFGVCKWGIPQNEETETCFKDANDDNNPDCKSTDKLCRKDMNPPNTSLLLSEDKKVSGNLDIPFLVSDEYSQDHSDMETYFSIVYQGKKQGFGGSSQTSDDSEIKSVAGSTSLDYEYPNIKAENNIIRLDSSLNTPGNYIIFYYSKDPANNLEVVKSEIVNVKTTTYTPSVDWGYSLVETEDPEVLLATLIVATNVHEQMWCNATLEALDGNNYFDYDNFVVFEETSLSVENPAVNIFEDLKGGSYNYNLVCRDIVGNTKSLTVPIGIEVPIPSEIIIG